MKPFKLACNGMVDNSFAFKMAEKNQTGKKYGWLRSLFIGFISLSIIVLVLVFCIIRFIPNSLSPLILREFNRQGIDIGLLEIQEFNGHRAILIMGDVRVGEMHVHQLPLELYYTLGNLMEKRVRDVVVHGATIEFTLKHGSGDDLFQLQDIPSLIFESYPSFLPFESVSITDSFIEINNELQADPLVRREFQAKILADGNFSIKSLELELSGILDSANKDAEIRFMANGTEPMQWIDLLGTESFQLLDCGIVNMDAETQIKDGLFGGGKVSLQTSLITTKHAILQDFDASILFGNNLVPQKLQANFTIHELKASGINLSPVPIEIQWEDDGSFSVMPDEGMSVIKIWRKDDFNAVFSDFAITGTLDEAYTPAQWQVSFMLSELDLEKQDITLRDARFRNHFDGKDLTLSMQSESATMNDLPVTGIAVNGKISSNALNLKGDIDFVGVRIPFRIESQTDVLGPIIDISGQGRNPKPDEIDLDTILNAASFDIGPIELMENPILNLIPSGLPESYTSGEIKLLGSVMKDTYTLVLTNASVHFPENDLRISESNTSVSFSMNNGLRTLDDATLSIGSLSIGKLEISNGSIPFSILPGNIFRTFGGSFEALGGNINLGPTTVQPDGYDTITTGILFFENIDFRKILQLTDTPPLELEGAFGGQLPFVFQKHGLELQSGFLRMNPGSAGRLQYEANGSFTRNVQPNTLQFKNMELAERALLGLDLSEMELKLFVEDGTGNKLPARAIIKGTYEEKNRKINLDLTLNLRGEVEKVLRNAAKGKLDLSFGF